MSVAAGSSHSLALTAEGALFSFGRGDYGQLGHGDTANQQQPKRVVALAKERVVGVAAGSRHSLALTAEGSLFSSATGPRRHSQPTAAEAGGDALKTLPARASCGRATPRCL